MSLFAFLLEIDSMEIENAKDELGKVYAYKYYVCMLNELLLELYLQL